MGLRFILCEEFAERFRNLLFSCFVIVFFIILVCLYAYSINNVFFIFIYDFSLFY